MALLCVLLFLCFAALEEAEAQSEEENDDDEDACDDGIYDDGEVVMSASALSAYPNDVDGMVVDGEFIPVLQGHRHGCQQGQSPEENPQEPEAGLLESKMAAIAQHGGSASLPNSPREVGVYDS